jgi:nanoRNase/pAp phosphatase (c-di-AMP/oligoRNAs hydrolase)
LIYTFQVEVEVRYCKNLLLHPPRLIIPSLLIGIHPDLNTFLYDTVLQKHMANEEETAVFNFKLIQTDTSIQNAEERDFRERYMSELRKKRQCGINNYYGVDELLEERKQVNQQQMKTPGRRGEIIKHEEISNEMSRRLLSRG